MRKPLFPGGKMKKFVTLVAALAAIVLPVSIASAKGGAPDKVEDVWLEGVVTQSSTASILFTGNVLYINGKVNPTASQVVSLRCALNQFNAAAQVAAWPVGTQVEVRCLTPKGTPTVEKIVPGHTFF